ncbi:MAG: two-component system, response regulator [Thermoplasmata archaeon]|jgi:CheY-like chemotaxis protein|nr:two-component system, response regulator [Thermoplasmata archaeon]
MVKTVLWAEDNKQDQFLIRAALKEAAAPPALKFADDGVLLLQALEQAAPDLVVLDLKMPRMGGLETLRHIRTRTQWNHLPVTVFSAGDNPDETRACRDLGVLDVVQKPVGFDLFAAAVHHILRAHQVSEESSAEGPSAKSPVAIVS